MNRFPTKLNSLSHLRAFLNDEIEVVIDIGVLTGTKELMKVFRSKKHVLVEPLTEYQDVIHRSYREAGIDYQLLAIAASNKKGSQRLRKKNHLPSLGSKYNGVTAADLVFDEELSFQDGEVTVNTDTLDNLKRNYSGPFLLKIDVDGAEFQILDGLSECDDVYVVVVESWMSRIGQFIELMSEKGFSLYDITDLCYMRGQLSQVDLVFLNKALMHNERYKEITPRAFGYTSAQEGNYFALTEEKLFNNEEKVHNLLKIANAGTAP